MKNGGGSSLLAGPRKGDTGKIRGVHAFLMERDFRAGRKDQGRREQIHIGKVKRHFRQE